MWTCCIIGLGELWGCLTEAHHGYGNFRSQWVMHIAFCWWNCQKGILITPGSVIRSLITNMIFDADCKYWMYSLPEKGVRALSDSIYWSWGKVHLVLPSSSHEVARVGLFSRRVSHLFFFTLLSSSPLTKVFPYAAVYICGARSDRESISSLKSSDYSHYVAQREPCATYSTMSRPRHAKQCQTQSQQVQKGLWHHRFSVPRKHASVKALTSTDWVCWQ